MSSVTVVVLVITLLVGPGSLCTATELIVSHSDTAINDIGVHVSASIVIVDILLVALLAMRDRTETPGGLLLGDLISLLEASLALDAIELPYTVGLNSQDLVELISVYT